MELNIDYLGNNNIHINNHFIMDNYLIFDTNCSIKIFDSLYISSDPNMYMIDKLSNKNKTFNLKN